MMSVYRLKIAILAVAILTESAAAMPTAAVEQTNPPKPRPTVRSNSHGVTLTARQAEILRRLQGRRGSATQEERSSDPRWRPRGTGRPPHEKGSQIDLIACDNDRGRIAALYYSADACSRTQPVRPSRPTIQQVTTDVVRNHIKHVRFPAKAVNIQPPGGKTLLNLATNFYTDPRTFERTEPILTWPVDIRATPASYTWNFGDGTIETTQSPGAPYPDLQVTHKYTERSHVRVNLTVNYDTWYQIPGGDWTSAGIVSIPGPTVDLLVCESTPVLVDPNNPDPPDPVPDPGNPCTQ